MGRGLVAASSYDGGPPQAAAGFRLGGGTPVREVIGDAGGGGGEPEGRGAPPGLGARRARRAGGEGDFVDRRLSLAFSRAGEKIKGGEKGARKRGPQLPKLPPLRSIASLAPRSTLGTRIGSGSPGLAGTITCEFGTGCARAAWRRCARRRGAQTLASAGPPRRAPPPPPSWCWETRALAVAVFVMLRLHEHRTPLPLPGRVHLPACGLTVCVP